MEGHWGLIHASRKCHIALDATITELPILFGTRRGGIPSAHGRLVLLREETVGLTPLLISDSSRRVFFCVEISILVRLDPVDFDAEASLSLVCNEESDLAYTFRLQFADIWN